MWTIGALLALTILWLMDKVCYAQFICPTGWNKLPQPMSDEEFGQAPEYTVNTAFPQFVQHPTGGTFIEGTPVNLRCALDVSAPGLQLVWAVNDTNAVECTKSNCAVDRSETASTLRIPSFSASMEGSYSCIAKNGNFTVTSSPARIIRPTFFGWLDPFPQESARKVRNGSTVVLVCNPNATAAVNTITWLVGGSHLSNYTNSSAAVALRYFDLGTGVQQVFCTVTFGDNLQAQTRKFILEPSPEQPSNVPLQFTLTPANVTVPLGGRVILVCIAEGNPWPVVSWQKDGVLLQSADSSVLAWAKATQEISGEYTCIASNGGPNNITTTAFVQVLGPPGVVTIQTVSSFKQNGSDIFLPALPDPQSPPLTVVQLECGMQSSITSDAEFRWLFRGEPLTTPTCVQTGNKLLMNAADVLELVGSVQCMVFTVGGASVANARLLISGKPNYPLLYSYSRTYFQFNFSWAPPTPVALVPCVTSYVVQLLAWDEDLMVCEREVFSTSLVLDAIMFDDETIRTRVAAKTEVGVLSDFVPTGAIVVSRVQPPPVSDLQTTISESHLGYQVALEWRLPLSSVYPPTSYSVDVDLQCIGTTALQVLQKDLGSITTYTRNINCCSNCSWSVLLTPVSTQPLISRASSSFQTGSIAFSSPPTMNSLQWYDSNGTSITINITLPVPSVLCHCGGPLVINVSYTNEKLVYYASFVLWEYQSEVRSYSRSLVLGDAQCWRPTNVSVAYQSPTTQSLFSPPVTLENSKLIDLFVVQGVALNLSSVAIDLKPHGAVTCILATKMGTFQLSYHQPEASSSGKSSGLQVAVSSPHLVLDGFVSNATVSVTVNITIGQQTRAISTTVYLEPPLVTPATSTRDFESPDLAERGMVIGIVTGVCLIGAVLFAGLIVLLVIYCVRRHWKSRQQQLQDEDIITQAVLQPEATDPVDTECHSIASTEATQLDRIMEYMKDVDKYSKGDPDGDVDNSMMEDPLAPICEDLQSVSDEKGIGIGLNTTGSMLCSQFVDAMELESLNMEVDDNVSLHSQTEARHLLATSSPVPKSKTKRRRTRTKTKGSRAAGKDSKIEVVPRGGLRSSQHSDHSGRKNQLQSTARRLSQNNELPVEIPEDRTSQQFDHHTSSSVRQSSLDHSMPDGYIHLNGHHSLHLTSQGYIAKPSLTDHNLPRPDIQNSSMARVNCARPPYIGQPSHHASSGFAGLTTSEQCIADMMAEQPLLMCRRDPYPDGLATQFRTWDSDDCDRLTAPCDHRVQHSDFDLASRSPCYGCNSSSSSCHYNPNPTQSPNSQSCIRDKYRARRPQTNSASEPLIPYPSDSACSHHHQHTAGLCPSMTGYCSTKGHTTTGCSGAGTSQRSAGYFEGMCAHSAPDSCRCLRPSVGRGCHSDVQRNRQSPLQYDNGGAGCPAVTCYGGASSHKWFGRMMAPRDRNDPVCDQRKDNYGLLCSGHVTPSHGHMAPYNHTEPSSDCDIPQYRHQYNASVRYNSQNHRWSHQGNAIPSDSLPQPMVATSSESRYLTQQPQQAEDLSHVAVVIPPSNPFPILSSPLPPPEHCAGLYVSQQTTQADNRYRSDGYVLSNSNADCCTALKSPTDYEGGIKHAAASSYVTVPSNDHRHISTPAYTNAPEQITMPSGSNADIQIQFLHKETSSVSNTVRPCIPSLLGQKNN